MEMREGRGHLGAAGVGDVRLRGPGWQARQGQRGPRGCGPWPDRRARADGAHLHQAPFVLPTRRGGSKLGATPQPPPPAPERVLRCCPCSLRGDRRPVRTAQGQGRRRRGTVPYTQTGGSACSQVWGRDLGQAQRRLGVSLAHEPAQSGVLTWFPRQDRHELRGRLVSPWPVPKSFLSTSTAAREDGHAL